MIKYEDTNENWYLTACQFVQNPSHFFGSPDPTIHYVNNFIDVSC